jgi:hypothetical protein
MGPGLTKFVSEEIGGGYLDEAVGPIKVGNSTD